MTAIRSGCSGAALLLALNADRLFVGAALAAALTLCGGMIDL